MVSDFENKVIISETVDESKEFTVEHTSEDG